MRIYLQSFRTYAPNLGKHELAIAEALLHLAGLSEVMDTPYGLRVFTVERMPDNVPMAGLGWAMYEDGAAAEPDARDCGVCGDDPEYRESCLRCGGSGKEPEARARATDWTKQARHGEDPATGDRW